jgi:hypothetical protein
LLSDHWDRRWVVMGTDLRVELCPSIPMRDPLPHSTNSHTLVLAKGGQ